jgi:glycosyltransferase involved in cell wall biosynthesis
MAIAITNQSPSSPLKALHVGKFYPPYMGGMETHLQALCESLQPRINVQVIVANQHRQSVIDQVHGVNVTRAGSLFNLSTAPICPRMIRAMRTARADLMHIHLPNPMAILAYFASGYRGKLVVTYHSDIVRQKAVGRAFEPILRRALDRCAAIIATSPNYQSSSPILSTYRLRSHVIPLGIQIDRYQKHDGSAVAKIRQRYKRPIVLSVGRLVYYKGYEYLIRAMVKARGHLLIVGQGPLRPALERLASECGVRDRVTFLGRLADDELVQYYYASSMFVLASIARSEAFGIVQLEAMACGRPVINTNLDTGVPYVSLDGVSGITVPPMDAEALSEAINRLLEFPSLSARLGEGAMRRVREEFTVEVMTHRTLQLYDQVMSDSASR